MIKKIMNILGYKVFTKSEYNHLTDSIASCGIYYRSLVGDDNEYHHGTRTVTVPLTELSNIGLVENCVWEDVKQKIAKAN
jgi:hypothetical protein